MPRELYVERNGWWDAAGHWWVVRPLDRLVAVNQGVWAQGACSLPRTLLAFGDDGTGNPFCAPTDGHDEVLRWSWVDGTVEHAEGTMDTFRACWLTHKAS